MYLFPMLAAAPTAAWQKAADWALDTGLKVLICLVMLLIGFRLVTRLTRKIDKLGEKPKYDKTLMRTVAYITGISARVLLVLAAVNVLGIDTSALSALIASLGLTIGLAVNGALANLAGSALILITRPFRVDDVIEAQGVSGVVEDIHMVCTKVRTFDNKVVYLPNGTLANGNIINYSEKDTRRVDFTFSIGYGDDFRKAKDLVMDICTRHSLVLEDPAPMVRVNEHGSSSVNLVARVWVRTQDYWDVYFDIMEAVKASFDENGIEIPFNQLDVHMK